MMSVYLKAFCFCCFHESLTLVQYHAFQGNIVASGGLGGEVFIWDLEAALLPVEKSIDAMEDDSSNGITVSGHSGLPITGLLSLNSSSSISLHTTQSHGYRPLATKGHKESVYALAMNESGTLLVSGGTEKVLIEVCIQFSF